MRIAFRERICRTVLGQSRCFAIVNDDGEAMKLIVTRLAHVAIYDLYFRVLRNPFTYDFP